MKLLYITNIPTPYRNKRYNIMQELFPELGISFEVLYMSWREPNRFWDLDLNEFKYPYKVYKGIHPKIGGMFAHFNPGLFLRLMKNDYDAVIVGGMGCPSHWLAPFFISGRKIKILSVETNLLSTTRKKGIGLSFKKFLAKQYSAFQVTGKRSEEYLNWLHPKSKKKRFIYLPNIIDEKIFTEKVNDERRFRKDIRSKLGVNDATQLWVCPARLEKIKGLHIFIPLLKNIPNIKVVVVGEGSMKNDLQSLIEQENLPVVLFGYKQQDEMLKLYAAADLFVLPSISDPSPLSPIEASAASLPLLVSDRIGNYPDVLENDKNGWGFNPLADKEEIRKVLVQISKCSFEQLAEKGNFSYTKYLQNFDTYKSIHSFGEQLLNVFNKEKKQI